MENAPGQSDEPVSQEVNGSIDYKTPRQKIKKIRKIRPLFYISNMSSTKKKVALLAVVLLVAAIATGVVFEKRHNANRLPANSFVSAGVAVTDKQHLFPRFSHVYGYADFAGAKWYAVNSGVVEIANGKVTYFTTMSGIPLGNPTSLVTRHNTLWLSTQYGVAILNDKKSAFVEMPVENETSRSNNTKLLNGKLLYDSVGDRLYLSAFKKLYYFDDANKQWQTTGESLGISSLSGFAFNKDFVVAASNSEDMPIWVYDRKKSTWDTTTSVSINKQSITSLFSLDDQIFIMGRGTNYTSCDDSGKYPATVMDKLSSAGVWQPMDSFNADVKRPELTLSHRVKPGSPINFHSSRCDSSQLKSLYSVKYSNNQIELTKQQDLDEGVGAFWGEDGVEQKELIGELMQATGHFAYSEPLAVDKLGNIILRYENDEDLTSKPRTTGLAVAEYSNIAKHTDIPLPTSDNWDTVQPILCDGTLTYVYIGAQEIQASHGEGFPNGKWKTSKLYKYVNGKLTTAIDLGGNVSEPRFSCNNGQLSWLGKSQAQQMTISDSTITSFGDEIPNATSLLGSAVYASPSGNLWALIPPSSNDTDQKNAKATLYLIDVDSKKVSKIGSIGNASSIAGASDSIVWVVSANSDYSKKDVIAYDVNGLAKTTKTYSSPVLVTSINDQHSLVLSGGNVGSTEKLFKATILGVDGSEKEVKLGSDTVIHNLSGPLKSFDQSQIDLQSYSLLNDPKNNAVWVVDATYGTFKIPYSGN